MNRPQLNEYRGAGSANDYIRDMNAYADRLEARLKTANELLGRLLNQADACAEFRKTFSPHIRNEARTYLNQQSK